jgi:hypothetical protein
MLSWAAHIIAHRSTFGVQNNLEMWQYHGPYDATTLVTLCKDISPQIDLPAAQFQLMLLSLRFNVYLCVNG